MKRLTIFLIFLLALSVAADYTTNVAVVETVDSPALETPAPTEAVNVTVIEETAPIEVPFAPSNETPILTEAPIEVPAEISTPVETPAATEAPTGAPENASISFAPVETPPPAIISTPVSESTSVPFAPVEKVVDENLTVIEEITSPPVAPELDDALNVMLHNLSNDSKTTEQLPVNISENISDEIPVSANTGLEVYDADGKVVNAEVTVNNDSVLIDFKEGPVQQILLLDAENVSELPRVDNVPTNFSSPVPGTTWAQVYAIDPTNTSFARGLVEVVAAGTKLYKCKNWNFDARSCDGDWVLVADDMVPGNTYYLDIGPDDPAFGEIIATAALHLDESGAVVSNIFEQIKAEDDIWSEPIPSNHAVRVTFETELTDGNVIDFVGRTNGSLVDVEIYVAGTSTLVGASRRFDRQMHEFIELSGVPSPTDTFDLKIIGLLTPECSPDDDCGFTDSAPLMEFDFINDAAISATGADGDIAYSSAGAPQPHYRQWNRTTQLWTSQANTLTDTNESTWIVMRSSHQFNKMFLMGAIQNDTNVSLQIGNGNNGTSNTTNWTQRFNLSFDVPNISRRSLDIGIEDISGDGIIVFENSTANDTNFALREWNGTALGGIVGVNTTNGSAALWLRAVPRPSSNEVMILALTSHARLWATLWNGTALINATGFNISANTGITTFEVFDFAWQANGDGLVAYRQGAQTQVNFRTFNSTNRAWSTNASLIDLTPGLPQAMSLCADPTSNYIGFISHDSTDDANVRIWNGTGVETAPAPPAENIDLEPTAGPARNVDCAWFADGSNATFVFVLAPAANDDLFAYVMYNKTAWNPGSLATPSNSTSVTGGPSIEELDLIPNPVRREIQAVVLDAVASADAFSALFNFTNWAVNPAGNYLLETTLTAACAGTTMCAGFDWDQFDPVPNITITKPLNNTNFSSGSQVNLTVNVTDNLFVANVTVNVTQPDNTVVRLNLSLFQGNTTAGNWSVNFTNATVGGRHDFTVCANDTSTHNNVNCTSGFFNIAPVLITNKSDTPDPVAAGGQINYTIGYELANDGIRVLNLSNIRFLTNNTVGDDSPNMIKTSNGTFLIVYSEVVGATQNLFVQRSVNNGQNFTIIPVTNDTVNDELTPNIMQANNGTVNVVYRNSSGSDDIYVISSTNDGITWGGNRILINTTTVVEGEPVLEENSSGMYFLLYEAVIAPDLDFEIYIRNSTNLINFSAAIPLTNNSFADFDPDILVGINDTVFIVWAPANGTNGTQEINFTNTTNPLVPGLLSSQSKAITNNSFNDYEPSLEQASTRCLSALYVAWVGLLNNSQAPLPDPNRTSNEIFVSRSFDLGNTFSATQLTNNTLSDHYPGLVQQGEDDFFYITFLSNNGSDMDVAFGQQQPGSSDLFNVTISDPVPANTTIVNGSISSNGTFANNTVSWFFPQIYACSSGNVTFAVTVNASTPNGTIINNTANTTSSIFAGTNSSTNATANTTVLANITVFTNVSVVKTDSPDPVLKGATLTYRINVSNSGNATATGVTVIETYPVNVTFNGSSPAPTIGNNTFVIGSLPPGNSTTINITVNVSTATGNGTILNNTVTVNYTNSTSLQSINTTINTTVIGFPVIITNKTDAPDPVVKGTTLRYQILINNTGMEIAYNVTVRETYPPNVTFNGSQPVPTSGNNTWNLGNIQPMSFTTINITVNVSPSVANGTVLTNTYNITFANNSGVNLTVTNSTTTTVQGIGVIVTIKNDNPDPVVRGQLLNYTILVNNTGDEIAYNITLVDTYPPNVTFISSMPAPTSGNGTFALGNFSPNQSILVNITVRVGPTVRNGTILNNLANATFANLSGVNNSASDTELTTVIGFPQVFANKSDAPDPVVNGTTLRYQILINNTGDEIAYNVTVFDLYPAFGVTFNGSQPAPTSGNNTWNLGTLVNGSFTTINITVNVSAANGTVLNNSFNATFANSSGVNLTVTNSTTTTVQGIGVIVTIKNDNPDPVVRGQLLNYTILVNNTGDEIAYNITLVDTYPPNVTFISSMPAPTSGNGTFSLGNFSPNQSILVNITVRVGPTVRNGTVLNNLANATFANLTGVNNSASDTELTTVVGFPQVFTNKSDAPDPVVNGTTLTYQILINNTGDEIAYNVTVFDLYPVSGVTFNGSSPAPTIGNNTWLLGNLTNGSFTTINITVNVSAGNGSVLNNSYNVTFANVSGTNLTVTNSTTTTVQGIGVIVTIKNDNPDPVVRGQTLNYSILVNNTGDEIAYNVTLVETYPPNVSFVSSSPVPSVGNGTFNLGNLSPNQSILVNITVTVGPTVRNGTVLNNLANATFANLTGVNASAFDTETTTVIGFPEVFANKSDAPDPVVNGTTLSYQITVANTGDEIAYNVTVFDLYPISGVTFNGSTPVPTVSNNTWLLGNLVNGSFTTINITVNVSAANGTVLNNSFNVTFANVTGVNTTITNSTTTTVQGIGVIVTIKNDNPDPVVRGQTLNYSILVNNTGDEIAYNVTLVETYPPNVSFVSSSPAPSVGNNTFNLGNFSPNQSILVNITVTVGPTVRNGTILNNLANATFANLTGKNASAFDTELTTVIGFPQVFTNKSDSPDPVVNGTTLTYQILISNTGDEIAYNVTVFDLYPISGVTFNGSSPAPTIGNNTWLLGTLLNGSFTTINITVNVSAGNGTVLNNSYNVTFANNTGVNTTVTNSTTTTVQGIGVIVTIKNDNPDPVVRGQTLNYTILVNNTGDEIAYNVTLVDTYPPNVSFITSSPAPSVGNNTFNLGNLSPNQSVLVNITVTVGPTVLNGTVLNNLANATFANLTGANASASDTEATTVAGFPVVFTNKTDTPDPVVNGTTLSYQITVINTGDEIAYNVTVFDLYPISGVTFNGSSPAPTSGNNTWLLGNLINGSSTTINITVNVSAANGTVLNNSYNLTFANVSGVNTTLTNSTTTTVQGIGVIVTIKNDNPDPVVRGQTLNYSILVNNTGDEIAYNVTLVETYPANVSFVSSSPAPSVGNNTFNLGNLSPNQSVLVNISVTVGPTVLNGTVLNNLANATFANLTGTNASASDTETTTVIGFPQVFTNKSDSPDPVVNGTTLTYQILISNTGDEIAYNVTVFDLYPTSGVTFNDSSPVPSIGNNTFLLGNLINGSSTTINITVNVSAANGTVLNNSYNLTFANVSGVNTTLTNSTTTIVQGIGVIVTIKNDNPDPVLRGQTLNYSILVNNTGDEIAYNVTLVDTYPPNVSFVSSSPAPTLGNNTFALGNLVPNQSILVNITVTVGPTVFNGTVLNNLANATFANLSGTNASASDTEATTVRGERNLTITKTDNPDPVASGTMLSYQVVVNNTGDDTAFNVTVIEKYPVNVTFNGSSPAPTIGNNTFSLGNLEPNQSTTINITVNVSISMTAGFLNNTAFANASNFFGTNQTVNVSELTMVVPQGINISNITLAKLDSPDPVVRGQLLNYTILVNSTGNGTAFNVTVVESYPPNVSFVSSSPAPTSGNGTFALGNLSNGTATTINITVSVGPTVPNGTILNNSVNSTFKFSNGINGSATDSETTTVVGFPVVTLTKIDTPDPVTSGSTLSYTIVITNTGDEIAYNITVVDGYPVNVTFNNASPANASGNNTFLLGNLTPGSAATVNITVNVSPAMTSGILNNTVNATFANASGVNVTLNASAVTTVIPVPPPPPGVGGGGGGNTPVAPAVVSPKAGGCMEGQFVTIGAAVYGPTCCSDPYCKSLGESWSCVPRHGLMVCELPAPELEVQNPFKVKELESEKVSGKVSAWSKGFDWLWLLALAAILGIAALVYIGRRRKK